MTPEERENLRAGYLKMRDSLALLHQDAVAGAREDLMSAVLSDLEALCDKAGMEVDLSLLQEIMGALVRCRFGHTSGWKILELQELRDNQLAKEAKQRRAKLEGEALREYHHPSLAPMEEAVLES